MIVNAHTHLELSSLAHLCPPPQGAPLAAWLQTVIAAQMAARKAGLLGAQNAVDAGIEMLCAAGTTHVGDITATGASVEPLLDSGLGGVVYLEVLGLNPAESLPRLQTAKEKIENYRRRENKMRVGLSVHAPYSCHPDLFRDGAAWCLADNVPLCVHVAESNAETEMLTRGAGEFLDMQRALNLPGLPVPGCSPIAYLESLGVLAAKPLLVHCVQVNDDDIRRIARSGAKVVHCPRSNQLLQCGRMPLEKFLAANVPVYLGTDSLASSPSLDVREEAEVAIELHTGRVTAETIRALLQSAF